MKRFLGITVLFLAMTSIGEAQLASTYHIFPQIADGRFPDGSSFDSTFVMSNVNAPLANCSLQLYGLGTNRFPVPTNSFPLGQGGAAFVSTTATLQIASGYATLTCTQPVKAFVIYRFSSSDGTSLGAATVFSSPATSSAYFLKLSSQQLGVAIANDTDFPQQYNLVAYSGNVAFSNTIIGTATITLQPRTNTAKYINELIATLPNNYGGNSGGLVTISSSAPFSVIGLAFLGSLFTTVPPFASLP